GYPCCTYNKDVYYTDENGNWSVENNEWCGIIEEKEDPNCWASKLGYPCCKYNKDEVLKDESGSWGIENDNWCGIIQET
ncbi:Non-catalytic module family DOC2, partial [Piromyces sp. E2]